MRTLLELITIEMKEAFVKAGYGEELARVTLSNRPDLCEYQCNGAMAGAKKYKKAPIMIAEDVVANLAESQCFAQAEAVKPGFINLKLKPEFVAEYLNEMAAAKAYSETCKPLCHELNIPQTAFDILLFLANNPEYKTARDIVEIRKIKANLVSVNVDKLVNEGYLERKSDS